MYDVHIWIENKVLVVFKQCEMPRCIRMGQKDWCVCSIKYQYLIKVRK